MGEPLPETWVRGATGSLFDVDNLPYGVFARPDEDPRVGARIGSSVVACSTSKRVPLRGRCGAQLRSYVRAAQVRDPTVGSR